MRGFPLWKAAHCRILEVSKVLLASIPSRLRYSTFYVPPAGNTKGGTFSAEPAVRQCGDLP